ncbi:MAG: hypothetical protein P8179_13010 [Candidatus Thiodiazotropha sp.]|jgi:hypothetical protein
MKTIKSLSFVTTVVISLLLSVNAQGANDKSLSTVKEILSKDFASLVKKELQSLGQKNPQPGEGFQVEITDDFDVIMRGAPELEPKAPEFHEGNAALFQEHLVKAAAKGMEHTSESFQKKLTEVLSYKGVSSGFEGIKEIISRLEKLTTNNKYDVFQKKFFLAYLDVNYRLGLIMKDFERLQARMKLGDFSNMSEIVTKVQSYSDRVGSIVYRPALGKQDIDVRKATWKALKQLAYDVKSVVKQ